MLKEPLDNIEEVVSLILKLAAVNTIDIDDILQIVPYVDLLTADDKLSGNHSYNLLRIATLERIEDGKWFVKPDALETMFKYTAGNTLGLQGKTRDLLKVTHEIDELSKLTGIRSANALNNKLIEMLLLSPDGARDLIDILASYIRMVTYSPPHDHDAPKGSDISNNPGS